MKTIKTKLRSTAVFLALFGLSLTAAANNLQITGKPALVGQDKTAGTAFIQFKVSWDNSWKVNKPNNYDAAWVFVKFREGGNEWQHAYIDTLSSSHVLLGSTPSGLAIEVGSSTVVDKRDDHKYRGGMGAFIYRTANGKGTVSTEVKLKWKYVDQDIDHESVLSLRVFAIEMVYVPEDAFTIGDRVSTRQLKVTDSNILYETDPTHSWPYNAPGKSNVSSILSSAANSINMAGNMWTASTLTSPWLELTSSHNWDASSWYWNWLVDNSSNTSAYTSPNGWHYITYGFPQPFKATHFSVLNWVWQSSNYAMQLHGSNNKSSWTALHTTYSSVQAWNNFLCNNCTSKFEIPANLQNAYKYYRLGFWTNSWMTLYHFGVNDEVGFTENDFFKQNSPERTIPHPFTYNNNNKILVSAEATRGTSSPLRYVKAPGNVFTTADGNSVALDPGFPSGAKGFYIMKNELSQHAYVDFLNTLSFAQQVNRSNVAPNAAASTRFYNDANFRNWIRVREQGTVSPAVFGCWVDGETNQPWSYEFNAGNVAMCMLNYADGAAYADWSGLRPLTELEYEKACRGPQNPVANEYAWGTANAVYSVGVDPSSKDKPGELASPSNTNFIQYKSANFPLRVACLATSTSTRTEAGASYWGVLNMTDNVSELYVNVSTAIGQRFDGTHGDGLLDANGRADMSAWPDNTTGVGVGFKGIYNGGANVYSQVSNRNYIETTVAESTRNAYTGFRGGRSCPKWSKF